MVYLDCSLMVHRRCVSKVGNYCGCEENVLALYEKWKESVSSFKKKAVKVIFNCSMIMNLIIIINIMKIYIRFIQIWIILIDNKMHKMRLIVYRNVIDRI
jgi:hypothetical protein